MKKVTFILILLLGVSIGYCLEPGFLINSDKQEYKTGEQLVFTVRYRNSGKENIKISTYDLEHKLKEGLRFVYQGTPAAAFKLVDYTKRKLPVFSPGADMFTIKPQEEYMVVLITDSVIPAGSSWKFIDQDKVESKWGEGIIKLPQGKYQVFVLDNVNFAQGPSEEQQEKKTNSVTIDIK